MSVVKLKERVCVCVALGEIRETITCLHGHYWDLYGYKMLQSPFVFIIELGTSKAGDNRLEMGIEPNNEGSGSVRFPSLQSSASKYTL